jgi:hypothetical protein
MEKEQVLRFWELERGRWVYTKNGKMKKDRFWWYDNAEKKFVESYGSQWTWCGFTFFAHKTRNGWQVVEASTGCDIGGIYKTKWKSVKEVEKKLQKRDRRLSKALSSWRFTIGESPWVELHPE